MEAICPFCDKWYGDSPIGWRKLGVHLANSCTARARVAGREFWEISGTTYLCWCGTNVFWKHLASHFSHDGGIAGHVLRLVLAYDPDAMPF